MTSVGAFIAACFVGGAVLGLTCRFATLIPGIALSWLWIALDADLGYSWARIATVTVSSAVVLQMGYLAGAGMAELIPRRVRRSILAARALPTSKTV